MSFVLSLECLRSRVSDLNSQIWAIASKGASRLTRDDFYVALRLIALGQSNRPIEPSLVSSPCPLPAFQGVPLPSTPANPTQGFGYAVAPSTYTAGAAYYAPPGPAASSAPNFAPSYAPY